MRKVSNKLCLNYRAVHNLILALTSNEDLQQDLWVAYLSGEINSTFSEKLSQLSLSYDIEKQAPEQIYKILSLNIPQDSLDQLSDIQASILLLTILGYSLEQVGKYNGATRALIDKEMVGLAKHPLWELYGSKTALQ